MDKRYEALRRPPQDALNTIPFGPLKGKSDINPQWKYEALTEQFGLCGIGWWFEITDKETTPLPTGELMIFVMVNLYVKNGDDWSMPIPGCGGDFIIVKDKNGIHGNDEALKMAVTDALGNACKMVGVAADIYRGMYNTKYQRYMNPAPEKTASQPARQPAQQSQGKTYQRPMKTAQLGTQGQNVQHSQTSLITEIGRRAREDEAFRDKATIVLEEMGKEMQKYTIYQILCRLSLAELQQLKAL